MPLPAGVCAVLTDIEGTTTPVSFVYEVLFPYAEARLDRVCAGAEPGSAEAEAIDQLRQEYLEETLGGEELPPFGDGAPYARFLMSQDVKSTGLKLLQGMIWRRGYEEGELSGQVFPDVPEALAAWRRAGVRLRVFSSGSVLAQKLLFGRTEHGDLTGYFEGFHDTTTGKKQEPASYAALARAFDLPAGEILFLSDVVGELEAAAQAGMATGLLVRPGNAPVPPHSHPIYRSFRELAP